MGLIGRKDPRERQAEKNRKHQMHQGMQQQLFAEDGDLNPQYLERLIDHGIDEATAYHIRNLLSQDFVLANLEKAEVDEIKWLTRVVEQKVFAMHPPEDSAIQGEFRKFLHDDEMDGLGALTDDHKTKINQVIMDVHARVSRSKSGWQQEELNKSISVSEVHDNQEESSGGIF